MRIPPNTHPVARIRNTLMMVALLLVIWLLLGLAPCTAPPATEVAATSPD